MADVCCTDQEDIEKECGPNAGYMKPSLNIACEGNVATIGAVTAGAVATMTMEATEVFNTWATSQKGTMDTVGALSDDGSTVNYTTTYTTFVKKCTGARLAALQAGAGDGKIVIGTDKNGLKWIIGEKENGCTVVVSPKINEKNGIEVVISWEHSKLLLEYTGVIAL
ncbi:MAG: hypothetical protein ABIV51_13820 [Saprospiraceae bacterium]